MSLNTHSFCGILLHMYMILINTPYTTSCYDNIESFCVPKVQNGRFYDILWSTLRINHLLYSTSSQIGPLISWKVDLLLIHIHIDYRKSRQSPELALRISEVLQFASFYFTGKPPKCGAILFHHSVDFLVLIVLRKPLKCGCWSYYRWCRITEVYL